MIKCEKCKTYKQELDKYKSMYELAKTGLTEEERNALIELICNEQLKHIIPSDEYGYKSEKYNVLEKLKAKIRIV